MTVITLEIGGNIVKREGIAALQKSRFTAVRSLRFCFPIALYSSWKLKCKCVMHEDGPVITNFNPPLLINLWQETKCERLVCFGTK